MWPAATRQLKQPRYEPPGSTRPGYEYKRRNFFRSRGVLTPRHRPEGLKPPGYEERPVIPAQAGIQAVYFPAFKSFQFMMALKPRKYVP